MRGSLSPCISGNLAWPNVAHVGRLRLSGWMRGLLISVVLATLACNATTDVRTQSSPSKVTSGTNGEEIFARFLMGGWAVPREEKPKSMPFAETLKAFVITTEEDLRDFLGGLDLYRVRGSAESLNRADFGEVVILAAYYQWRPLKGDPLSIRGITQDGTKAEIDLELLENPQGREYPYLMAPLHIAAVERRDLPRGVPLKFVFLVNGQEAATIEDILE